MIKIKKGLDLPISGEPQQHITDAKKARTVAVVGSDYVGMKPTMAIKVGDKVKLGQLLFTDKKTEGVRYTAPAAGTVSAINRGAKRILQSVVIDVEGDESEAFESYAPNQFASVTRDQVRENLVNSGMWTALRTRPFSKVPALDAVPHSIFVTAMDSNPLAADASIIIAEQKDAFNQGLVLLAKLTEGKVFVCKEAGKTVDVKVDNQINVHEFGGVHPAGLVGTHIHFLDPVSTKKSVWTIGYQDVIAIAHLFTSGQLSTARVIALAGPMVTQPRLLRTQLGANIDAVIAGELESGEVRVISGSVLSGRKSSGVNAYLGRFHTQITVLQEGRDRPFLHYLRPGFNNHSVANVFISKLFSGKKFSFTTTTNGSERAMVPIGSYEKVMPLDILPTQLLRSLIVQDLETAELLGALELDEEDLALCTYVCPGKYEYGEILRQNLSRIELEG